MTWTSPVHRFQMWPFAVSVVALHVLGTSSVFGQDLQFADLGTCPLESGEVIRDCVIGYRVVGELNEDRSNAVLFPAWGGGRSEQLLDFYVGPGGWVDTDTHFVIMVDPFGNGVSSSPSNSPSQPGDAFPAFTIRDAVRAQHRLVTEVLGLEGLHAVVGISWGAFCAFEWATTFPGFAARVVPVAGTPRTSPYELLRIDLNRRILAGCEPDRCDAAREAYVAALRVSYRSPRHWDHSRSLDEVTGMISTLPQAAANMPAAADILAQNAAWEAMDVSAPFGGSLERAAAAVRGPMLVIVVGDEDALVPPAASKEFARLAGARLVEVDSDCGHQFFVCEDEIVRDAIRDFLR